MTVGQALLTGFLLWVFGIAIGAALLWAFGRVTLAVGRASLEATRAELLRERTWREYWQKRAEKFLDHDARRNGVTNERVMRDTPATSSHPLLGAFAGLGITEIDSTAAGPRPSGRTES